MVFLCLYYSAVLSILRLKSSCLLICKLTSDYALPIILPSRKLCRSMFDIICIIILNIYIISENYPYRTRVEYTSNPNTTTNLRIKINNSNAYIRIYI